MIHFLTERGTDLGGVDTWDPDGEPHRFASSFGHYIIELHRRLGALGCETTIGSVVPRNCTLVVVFVRRHFMMRPLARLQFAWSLRRYPVIFVRGDLPEDRRAWFRFDLEIVPNCTFLEMFGTRRSRLLPSLPQRGLIPRNPGRDERVDVLCLKANPGNIPQQLQTVDFLDQLATTGVVLDIDAPTTVDGADQRWHDFESVDVALCARREGQHVLCKPPTKLVNAWAAGVIPIAMREPAYVDIARDRENVMFIDSVDAVPRVIHEIQSDPVLRSTLRKGVADAAAVQPSTDDIVALWWSEFRRHESAPSILRSTRSILYLWWHTNFVSIIVWEARAFVSKVKRCGRSLVARICVES